MTRAYSNKALPAGTVLREWRLEDVLGVGGFGIVYKARGIYFNELVAIKEYFPSSISERDSDATVVPIDSDSEEVHALGLKKFVEEAKLLWNLSSPSRHPNIVSVRSLFEIHGTAYMVMDFEDGVSLSKMLKQGRRFNERSLWNILRPIAEGLDRAHRVGVLHRDIKPPNILINEDNRPVLIDFGSARFEAAEATSTTVTFHTPPYAAIEQYVKTYEQGPWTDVYALGVVLHECITGEKPPEVLERLHAGLGEPLATGKWPGYSKQFLTAVDAAMTVKPGDRPQTISSWLAMFGKQADDGSDDDDADDEATRFYAAPGAADGIAHLPGAPDTSAATLATGVPSDPKEATFHRVGQDISQGSKVTAGEKDAEPPDAQKAEMVSSDPAPPVDKTKAAPDRASATGEAGTKKSKGGLLAAAGAGLILLAGGGYALLGNGKSGPATEQPAAISDPGATAPTADTTTALDAMNPAMGVAANGMTAETVPPANAAPTQSETQKRDAAVEARLAAKEKAVRDANERLKAVKAAAASASTAPIEKTETTTAAKDTGASSSKLSQLYSIVDDGRAQAKLVMRSNNSQNAQLARTYDANLKALRASARGARTDDEIDRMIKQASQTRAYIRFLVKQE
nr:serine/threonine-protein kinase [uncultured Sphingomonas sp.]